MRWPATKAIPPFIAIMAFLLLKTPSCADAQGVFAHDAPIGGPTNLATSQGYLFVLEMRQHRVKRIDMSTGVVTTVAGDGKNFQEADGSNATDCVLGFLFSMTVDHEGDIFLGEDSRVRKVDASTGVISTVAGSLQSGGTVEGIPAKDAKFWQIDALAVDPRGNLFIADGLQGKLFKVDSVKGIISRYGKYDPSDRSGDSGAIDAGFQWPKGIGVDKDGNLYVADDSTCRVRRIEHDSGFVHALGAPGDGDLGCVQRTNAHESSFYSNAAVDTEGNTYFSDVPGNRVWRIDAKTSVTSIFAGSGMGGYSGDAGLATLSQLHDPEGLAVDSQGNLYISDFGNNRIRRVDARTRLITTFAGTEPAIDRRLQIDTYRESIPVQEPVTISPPPLIEPLPAGPRD